MPFINEVRLLALLYSIFEHLLTAPHLGYHVFGKGFLTNLLRGAPAHVYLQQGTATRDDIDTTLKLGMNHPMGPLQLGKLHVVVLIPSSSINELPSSS